MWVSRGSVGLTLQRPRIWRPETRLWLRVNLDDQVLQLLYGDGSDARSREVDMTNWKGDKGV